MNGWPQGTSLHMDGWMCCRCIWPRSALPCPALLCAGGPIAPHHTTLSHRTQCQALWEADQPARSADVVGPEHTFSVPAEAAPGTVFKLGSETYNFMRGHVEVCPLPSQGLGGQGGLGASSSSVCSAAPIQHDEQVRHARTHARMPVREQLGRGGGRLAHEGQALGGLAYRVPPWMDGCMGSQAAAGQVTRAARDQA